MGSNKMVEWPAALKGLAILLKHPLAVCSLMGALAGSAVIASYQKKEWLKIMLTNTAVAVALTPLVIRLAGEEPTPDTYAGFACIVALASHLVIKVCADRRIHDALVESAAHQIEKFGPDDK